MNIGIKTMNLSYTIRYDTVLAVNVSLSHLLIDINYNFHAKYEKQNI